MDAVAADERAQFAAHQIAADQHAAGIGVGDEDPVAGDVLHRVAVDRHAAHAGAEHDDPGVAGVAHLVGGDIDRAGGGVLHMDGVDGDAGSDPGSQPVAADRHAAVGAVDEDAVAADRGHAAVGDAVVGDIDRPRAQHVDRFVQQPGRRAVQDGVAADQQRAVHLLDMDAARQRGRCARGNGVTVDRGIAADIQHEDAGAAQLRAGARGHRVG